MGDAFFFGKGKPAAVGVFGFVVPFGDGGEAGFGVHDDIVFVWRFELDGGGGEEGLCGVVVAAAPGRVVLRWVRAVENFG